MLRKPSCFTLVQLATLVLVGLSTVFVLAGCGAGPAPPDISVQSIASFEVGSRHTGSRDALAAAYNQATARNFSMETEPTPLATLHLRDGSAIQLNFSDNFPRDCVFVYVGPGTEERGEFYTVEAPGLLSAVCGLGNIDRSEFEPSP